MTVPQTLKPLQKWTDKNSQLKPLLKPLLLGGALVTLIALVRLQPRVEPSNQALDPNQFCQEIVLPDAKVNRQQLSQLLAIPERSQRTQVEELLQQPYCRMSEISIRAGATTERNAYPLESEPQTWLVILYEGDSYVGYGFKHS